MRRGTQATLMIATATSLALASCIAKVRQIPTPPGVGLNLFESRVNGAAPPPTRSRFSWRGLDTFQRGERFPSLKART